ncbi:FadR/GntR family transcriptional regulator [Mesorhizobium sp. SP-1A]|uniref:FadR/GntR family transcriptional regulator n=1 Tax=Mesorhizobium sp. SP-1A TaxID=3077840 RepID=UPI0028F73CD2|nr:FCD domain-containing protein [Mesorhizobium sp. SP-1A]
MTRTSAVQGVVDTLRVEIPQNYRPGDLLQNERLIAERLGVSRNTVREALIHLEAFGVIEKTQRGPRVCAPNVGAVFHIMDQYFDRSLKTCLDLLDFRRMMDIGALPQVVERVTEADIQTLERHVGQMQRSLTAREDALADYAFHNEIVRISGNHVLETLYKVLSHTLVFYMEIGKSNPVNREKTFDDHRAIIKALADRSLDAAVKAFSEHYNYSERSVRAAYDKAGQQERAMEGSE